MKYSTRTLSMMLLAGTLAAGVTIAQQHETHEGGPPLAGTTPAAGCCANMGNQPAGQPKLGEMPMAEHKMDMSSCPHMQAGALADQLIASFSALEQEQDLVALKLKLAAHGNLLKQLKTTTEKQCPMMEHMGGMMGGGMMNMPGMTHPAPTN